MGFLCRPGSEDENTMWYTIDQWAINAGRDYLYNDHIHYSGKLTHATLFQVLNTICPKLGIDPDFIVAYANRIIFTGAYDHYNIYFADKGGYLHKFLEKLDFVVDLNKKIEIYADGLDGDKTMIAGRASSNACLDFFLNMKLSIPNTDAPASDNTTSGGDNSTVPAPQKPALKRLAIMYDLPESDFNQLFKSDNGDSDISPTACSDHNIVKGSGRTVYLLENYRKRAFMSFQAFASRGFDFSNLVALHDWMLELIPDGPNLE